MSEIPLDELAAAAYEARTVDRVQRAQVNKLLEMLESLHDVNLLLVFLARQVNRREWGRNSASRLYKVLRGKNVDEARRILGVFRWLYESVDPRRVSCLGRVATPAPKGFFEKFMEVCLG